ncbi:MAG TPA: DNA polymerase III subunit delta [Acidimicrobiales bacterium]|nr:DNA polymerase III subunit delta [Acidimicrobiales bacterium]
MTTTATDLPVYLVKGDDPGLLSQSLSHLLALLGGGGGLVEDFGPDVEVSAIVEACQTPPFLADRRIVVARDVGRFRVDEAALLVEYLADPNPTTALVLVGGGGALSRPLADAVRKGGHVLDAAAPKGKARTSWLVQQARDGPVRLDAGALDLIGEHLGEDIARLSTLLDGLASAYGEGATVGADEVMPFLGQAGSVAPWELTDAIDRGDVPAAITTLHRILGAGERHALVVLASLHRHYQAMLRLDGAGVTGEQEAAALLGTAPFPAKKAMSQGRTLGSARLAKAITLLADADVDLRGARDWPDELVLEVLVARLARLAPRATNRATNRATGRAGSARRR